MNTRSLVERAWLLLLCIPAMHRSMTAQDALITEPTKPIAIHGYALINTSITDSTNNLAAAGGRGDSLVVGGEGLCCGSLAGFSGAADFGKGLGGVFQLETGFVLNRGTLDQQGQIFGRQAYAGFTTKVGPVFNVVSVGRQYGIALMATAPLDPYGHGAQAANAWDCLLFGVNFDRSIQDVMTVGNNKIMFGYSPGSVPGSNASGTSIAGGVIYELEPFLVAGTVAHSQDATRHSLDVYGSGLRYTHKALNLYGYNLAAMRDPDFGDTGTGQGPIDGSGEPLANTSLSLNLGNTRQRKDHFVNLSARYDLKQQYALIGMYKFDSARQVNSAGQHGTASSYIVELARGIGPDFFLYGFAAYTHLTGAELSDPNSPNGSFAGASGRTYAGLGLNYRFTIALK